MRCEVGDFIKYQAPKWKRPYYGEVESCGDGVIRLLHNRNHAVIQEDWVIERRPGGGA